MTTPKERSATQPEAALADVLRPEDYIKGRAHVFVSLESFKWFARKHRASLFERGALLEIGGRLLVVERRFDAAVIELSNAPRSTSGRAA